MWFYQGWFKRDLAPRGGTRPISRTQSRLEVFLTLPASPHGPESAHFRRASVPYIPCQLWEASRATCRLGFRVLWSLEASLFPVTTAWWVYSSETPVLGTTNSMVSLLSLRKASYVAMSQHQKLSPNAFLSVTLWLNLHMTKKSKERKKDPFMWKGFFF